MPLHKLRRAGGEGFNGSYISVASSTSPTAHTFNSVSFGIPNAKRLIVIAVMSTGLSGSSGISSMTIGGVSATSIDTQASGSTRASLYYAAVPTGASGTIIVNCSSNEVSIAVFRIIYGSSSTPTNTGKTSVASGNISLACTVPSNGFGIVCIADDEIGSHTATNYTERFDEDNSDNLTGGDFTTSATLTCQNTTNNTNNKALVYASWGP